MALSPADPRRPGRTVTEEPEAVLAHVRGREEVRLQVAQVLADGTVAEPVAGDARLVVRHQAPLDDGADALAPGGVEHPDVSESVGEPALTLGLVRPRSSRRTRPSIRASSTASSGPLRPLMRRLSAIESFFDMPLLNRCHGLAAGTPAHGKV